MLLVAMLPFANQVNSQSSPCASDQIHEQLLSIDPMYAQRMAESSPKFQQFLAEKAVKKGNTEKSTITYTIPLVFHVIYTSSSAANNISDAQIQSAVQRLNEIYSNATGTTVDTKIQFQLATMDENCNATTGINRVNGASVTNYSNHGIDGEVTDSDGIGASMSSIFNLSRWDPDLYLNIYIVSEITNNDGGYGTQAYAFYPTTSDSYYGVVIMYNTLGYDYNNCGCYQLKSYTNQNETLAHEVGHALYLKHTFEGGSSSSCPSTSDSAGDEVADTPAHKYITYCPSSGGNSCYASSDAFYSWGKIKYNIMGYFTETCTNQFSQGQADRMLWALETYKPTLLYSPGLQTTSVTMAAAACTPQTTTGLQGEFGTGPIGVTIGDMTAGSNSTYQDGGYLSRPCFIANLEINQSYPVEVTTWGNYSEDVRVYIDWNNDGSMSASELVFSGDNAKSFSGTFTVPTTTTTGQHLRARVISDYQANTISSSCYAPVYGQVEDYPVYVAPLEPKLSASAGSLYGFQTLTTKSSASQNFKISGSDLSSTVSLSLSSSSYELSSDGTTWAATLSFTPSNLVLSEKNIYVRLKSGQTTGTKSATLTVSHTGATSKTVSLTGEVGEVSKLRGNSVTFDGTGDYLQTAFNAISGGQSRTCEAWVKTTANDAGILSFGSANNYKKWMLRTDSNGRLRIEIGDGYKVSTNTITDGNWHHVAVVLNNASGATLANTTLYIDGMAETPFDVYNSTKTIDTDAAGYMTIGKDLNDRYFTGEIDEVRIWTTARSGTEVRSNMHLTLDGTESGLVAYYQFNESSGTAKDWVGNYNGSFNGNAAFTTSGINCGREGTSQTVTGISSTGAKSFSNAKLSIDFLQKTGSDDFTATYQAFTPNSVSGTDDVTPFDSPVWTINQSTSSGSYLGNLSFTFPANTLTDAVTYNYALYHRGMGSSGAWAKIVNEASSLNGNTITFDSISQTGQFMVAQTGISTERGKAIVLDGVDDYLESSLDFDPATSPFTVECWLKMAGDSTDFQVILNKSTPDYSSHFFIGTWYGKIWTGLGRNLLPNTIAYTLDRSHWNHLAFTWDNQTATLYLNGKIISQLNIANLPANTTSLDFGKFLGPNNYFAGEMDELRYWATARTQQEVLEEMHLTAEAKMGSNVQYFQLNNSATATSGGNELVLHGNPSYVNSGANVGEAGAAQYAAAVATSANFDFENANLSINANVLGDLLQMTAVYQEFAPNSKEGIAGTQIFETPTWTLHETTEGAFSADIVFKFPAGTFTNTSPAKYQLYHRAIGSEGTWSVLVDGASAVSSDTIQFNGISTTGQFLVVEK